MDRDYNNYKPFRTYSQKAEARRTARKVNGTWISNAPVSTHPILQQLIPSERKYGPNLRRSPND